MNKQQLRKEFLDKRKAISRSELEELSNRIKDKFLSEPHFQEAQHVHCFLSIARHKEIDTWPIIHALRELNKQIIISTCDFKTLEMHHFLFEKETILEETAFGILEPINAKPFSVEKIDLIIVPLLIFDKEGYRVGYGKGIYDRFLAKCRPDAIKVGLSISEPIQAIADSDKYDIALDHCITPKSVHSF
ncbi:5-formyltetrahydrofolate cyclo-ligase [Aureibacter tunicatorum]|uniref:5-formyltetrahydrofolate cyclo-ligase n=1 Tax=Aureibacter tunicatorum TaxID=866807 RepID=A0AAE3XKL3_9BACT|nr:5-formyltetrahydrofolate cyclo-ligase [Aureibacter tunicatorum]MDR6238147.1 5-formyltetrahydrofolate cyclo-ligase [Aureibacter tunicatorum]BDD03180.1 5-formyltetrahydrofolate cyclo-ligase [Aureibacter tunicatorum]